MTAARRSSTTNGEKELPAPTTNLKDVRISLDAARDLVAGVVLRMHGAGGRAARESFAGFLERLSSAMRAAPNTDRSEVDAMLREIAEARNFAADLAEMLVHTGRLRTREERRDLSDCCGVMAALLADDTLPDELWERWLDRRKLTGSARLRQLWLKSKARKFRHAAGGLSPEKPPCQD